MDKYELLNLVNEIDSSNKLYKEESLTTKKLLKKLKI